MKGDHTDGACSHTRTRPCFPLTCSPSSLTRVRTSVWKSVNRQPTVSENPINIYFAPTTTQPTQLRSAKLINNWRPNAERRIPRAHLNQVTVAALPLAIRSAALWPWPLATTHTEETLEYFRGVENDMIDQLRGCSSDHQPTTVCVKHTIFCKTGTSGAIYASHGIQTISGRFRLGQ